MEIVDADIARDNMFAKVKAATLNRILGPSTTPETTDEVECRTVDFKFGTGRCWTDPDMPRMTSNILDNRGIAMHHHEMHVNNGYIAG